MRNISEEYTATPPWEHQIPYINLVLFIAILLYLTSFLFFNLPYSCRFLLFFPLSKRFFVCFYLFCLLVFLFLWTSIFNFFISVFPSFFISHFSSFCSISLQFLPPPSQFLICSITYHVVTSSVRRHICHCCSEQYSYSFAAVPCSISDVS